MTTASLAVSTGGTPLVLMPQPTALVPLCYIVHVHSRSCRNCGTVHEWSEAYAMNEIRSRTGMGNYIQHLVPIQEFTWNIPIRVVRISTRLVPACHECAPFSLSHLPTPEPASPRCVAAAQDAAEGGARGPRGNHPAKPRSIHDLLDTL